VKFSAIISQYSLVGLLCCGERVLLCPLNSCFVIDQHSYATERFLAGRLASYTPQLHSISVNQSPNLNPTNP